ncbi:MAG: outer membrane beta-barrel protein [Brumimicrobium sp.]
MKKIKLTFIAVLLITTTSFAQSPIAKGGAQFNAGVGLSTWGIPVYLGFDFGIHKDITIGGEVSFRTHHDRYKDYRYNHSIFGFSGNANYHFNSLLNIPPKFDFYAGLNVGFYYWNSPKNYYGQHYSGLGIGAQVGGRYYFNERIGINLEFGGGNAFNGGKIGISIKL